MQLYDLGVLAAGAGVIIAAAVAASTVAAVILVQGLP
jgi:hypothetical protein